MSGLGTKNITGLKVEIRPDSWDETVLTQELLLNVYKVHNPKVVVDIGAHIGGTSMRLCLKRGYGLCLRT